jgi:hypothetical protein
MKPLLHKRQGLFLAGPHNVNALTLERDGVLTSAGCAFLLERQSLNVNLAPYVRGDSMNASP